MTKLIIHGAKAPLQSANPAAITFACPFPSEQLPTKRIYRNRMQLLIFQLVMGRTAKNITVM
jgi:hypothetical protein